MARNKSDPVEIPVPGESEMAIDASVLTHLGHMLMQSGNVAQNNFLTVQKVIDYDFLENKRVVNLDEALGAREVASQKSPAGPKVE